MTTTMDYKTKDYPELNAWIKNMRFTNSFLLKEEIKNTFIPLTEKSMDPEKQKYFVKRFYRHLNKLQENNAFSKFLKDPKVINFIRHQFDYDYWCEWMLLEFNSIEEAAKFIYDFDPDWIGEIEVQLQEHDCTGQTFSRGMELTQVAPGIVFAQKRYSLDV